MLVCKNITVFTDTFHSPHSAVTIIVIFFVHARPLVDLHQSHIRNKQFQFIFCESVYLFVQTFGTFKIHFHKCTKSQIIASLCFSLIVKTGFVIGFQCRMIGRIQIFVTISIRSSIQRVDKTYLFGRCCTDTRKECCEQQHAQYIQR